MGHRRGGRLVAAAAAAAAAAALVLLAWSGRPLSLEVSQAFAGFAAGAASKLAPQQLQRPRHVAVSAAAEGDDDNSWAGATSSSFRPTPPNSTEAMCWQAAEAVMRAYRDGYTRQSVRLRLDAAYDSQDMYTRGVQYLLRETLPIAKSFATKLWSGEYLKEVKTTIVDGETSTLLYRESDNARMDAAVFFLPARDLVTSPKFKSFYQGMGDRLIVLSNTEQAAANWKVENKGKDFYLIGNADAGFQICELFSQQSYYYFQTVMNNWQMTFFRAYPHPWEIYIEDLNYNMVKVGESEEKPGYDQIIAWMEAYEEANNIQTFQKVGKYLKDNQEAML